MRTKIIAGNLVAVLVVGLASYFVVSAQLRSTFLSQVDNRIANDTRIIERSFRLSAHELVEQTVQQASSREARLVYGAPTESRRRESANRQANRISDWLARQGWGSPPELVAFTDDRGMVIARDRDVNRMLDEDLSRSVQVMSAVLQPGSEAHHDVWLYAGGPDKLLQLAIAPVRDENGELLGTLVTGYDLSNGMARRAGELIGRDVAFLLEGRVYSSTFEGDRSDALRRVLFEDQASATTAALTQGGSPQPFMAAIGGDDYVGTVVGLPTSPSTQVAVAVLANRSSEVAKAAPLSTLLVMTLLGIFIVVGYGMFIGASFLRPIAQMEESVLAMINGRTDLRLEIESAELGGLAYRINQLINVFTDTPEADEEGRVSQPPPSWDAGAGAPPAAPKAAAQEEAGDEEDPELAARLEAEPEAEYHARVYQEYVEAKRAAGEDISNIPQDRFVQRLQANEKQLIKKHGCRMVRFQVHTRGNQVNLRPVIIR